MSNHKNDILFYTFSEDTSTALREFPLPFIYCSNNNNNNNKGQVHCLQNNVPVPVYRYAGSDILEPAIVLKQSKVNLRVATKLQEYNAPVIVAKQNAYAFNQNILSAIQALRNERTATIMRYDQLIQSHWQHLQPYE